jgi:hypothetical protein
MSTQQILLFGIEGLFLVVDCHSNVVYQNQVGGNVCWQAEQEGALAAIDVSPESLALIEGYAFPTGAQGISEEVADFLDSVFRKNRAAEFLSVDRARLHESWEAWVYVKIADVPEYSDDWCSQSYFGPIFGFSSRRGVVTWPNSD